jgi:hypothetical protein
VKCELAAYQAACKRWPREAITLRQGGHSNQPARDPPRQGQSCGRLGAGVGRLGSRERHRLCSSLNHVFAASPAPASQPRARSSFGHLVGAADQRRPDFKAERLVGPHDGLMGRNLRPRWRYTVSISSGNSASRSLARMR